MPRPTELTAYVARTRRASRFSAAKAGDAVKKLLPILENATEEAAQLQRSLSEAHLAETDPARAQRYEEAFQKLGAIHRIAGEMSLQARQLVQAFRELEAANERIATESEPAPTGSAVTTVTPAPRAVKQTVVRSKPEK